MGHTLGAPVVHHEEGSMIQDERMTRRQWALVALIVLIGGVLMLGGMLGMLAFFSRVSVPLF